MGKFNKIQNSFTSGQVSDKFKGRTDLKEYNDALDQLENFIVLRQGGVSKRPGTQYIEDLNSSNFRGERIIPFVFSKSESYAVIINGLNTATLQVRIFRADGTEATVDETNFRAETSITTSYNPKNWKYSQSGDILVLSYSSPLTVSEIGSTDLTTDATNEIPPFMIVRTDKDNFDVFNFTHPDFLSKLPSKAKFSPAVNRPYLPGNADPDLRFYITNENVGSNRTLICLDSSGTETPFFKTGHAFTTVSGRPGVHGAFFKVQRAGTEGVCWVDGYKADVNLLSANIDTGTDVLTITAHGFSTRDTIHLFDTGVGTAPTISGVTPDANGFYGRYYVRGLTANTLTLHPTIADADAGTNTIDFTSAGSGAIMILEAYQVTRITVTVEVAFDSSLTSAANATDDWHESAWSAEQGFPRAVVFHEQRLVFGGTRRRPDTVWFSQVGNIFNFMSRRLEQDTLNATIASDTDSGLGFILFGDVLPSGPFDLTAAATQANIIQWMASQNALLIGTLGTEYAVTGFDSIISLDNFSIKKQTDYGSNTVQAITVGSSVLFCSRDGRRIRDFKFNRQNGSYLSTNLTVISDDIVYSGFDGASATNLKSAEFIEITHQPSRDVAWFLTSNNELVALTLSRESQIAAWHYHPIRSTDRVLSMSVIPSDDGTFDELWMVIERSIDGNTEVYLEKMGDDFEHDVLNNTSSSNDDVPYYADSAIKVTLGSMTNVVTGLSHLEGETVKVLADGVVENDKTVSSGQITLDATYNSGTVIVVGLPYTSTLKTLDIEAGGDFGSSQGNRQRIDRVALRMFKAQKGQYRNQNASSSFDLEYDDDLVFTGIKRVDFEITPDMDNQVVIEHDDPVPFTLLSMTYRGVSFD